ncbi:MAG: phage tail protein [Anaerolineae bacterium]|nr:phage tail protein [Anaerolineae bacterium]
MSSRMIMVDSLVANEFAVELDGTRAGGILRIAGLVTLSRDEHGQRRYPPFEVSKMVERDGSNAFNRWLRETHAARQSGERPRRDLAILAIDDGTVTRRWLVKQAWIMAVHYSPFDSGSFEIVAETFTIGYDDIEESFPVSDA